MFMDDHESYHGTDAELACDTFAANAFEFWGGPPQEWLKRYDIAKDEYTRLREGTKAVPSIALAGQASKAEKPE